MKAILTFLGATALTLMVVAQQTASTDTNTPPAEPVVAAASLDSVTNTIEIESDQGELRTETNYTAVYTGNVRATYGDSRLTCEELTIRAQKGAERPEYVLANRNVVIVHKDKTGKPILATGDTATYTFAVENLATNEIVVLSGGARIESERGLTTGETLTWDLATGVVRASNQRTVIRITDGAENKLPFGNSRTNAP